MGHGPGHTHYEKITHPEGRASTQSRGEGSEGTPPHKGLMENWLCWAWIRRFFRRKGADFFLMSTHLEGAPTGSRNDTFLGDGGGGILWKEELNKLKGPFQFQILQIRRVMTKCFI